MKYAVVLVVAAVILPGLQALGLNSQSEEAVLNRWLDDLAERQSFQGEEEDPQDATPTEDGVEGYLAEFFSPHEEKEPETFNEEAAERDGNFFANFENFDSDSAHFNEEEEAVSEDEVGNYFTNFNFFDPDSEMAHVEISEECRSLRARVAEKEKMVHDTEIALDEHEVRLRDAMNILKAEKDRSCDGDCKLICVPGGAGYKCAAKAWGKCISRVPVMNTCAKKVRDPACVALEAACKKKKEMAAANVKAAQAKRDETRNKLRALEKELKDLAESASSKGCKEEDTVDCEEWKKRVTDAVKRVATQIAVAAANQGRLAAATAAHNSAKAKSCDLNCKEVCLAGDVGYKCTAKVWGKCISRVPVMNPCAKKVIDPACRDLEEECKKEKVTAAARVLAAQRNLNASKDKLQKARDDANTVRVNVPQECKKGLE